jgi:ferritin-like protein
MNAQALVGPPPESRSALLRLLTQACELEHGLACSYLYAAFSLKQDLSEGGMTWQDLQRARLWAAQIYFVAAEEMLHLAQVWNLLAAIGGTPYYLRPNFPLPTDYYPLNISIVLERFSLATLDRFIQFEKPADVTLAPEASIIGAAGPGFDTIGELYEMVAHLITRIPEDQLFIAGGTQVGTDLVDFPNIVRVSNRESALAAVHLITEQGEGIKSDRDDSHFGMFRGVRATYLEELARANRESREFGPVRPCISNPVAILSPVSHSVGAQVITNPSTVAVADCFDAVYSLMLRLLQFVFDHSTTDVDVMRDLSRVSLELMTSTLKPLGEGLTAMPAGEEYEGQTAGPGFVLTRHVPLPRNPVAARMLALEKLDELTLRLRRAAALIDPEPPPQVGRAADNIAATASRLRDAAPVA